MERLVGRDCDSITERLILNRIVMVDNNNQHLVVNIHVVIYSLITYSLQQSDFVSILPLQTNKQTNTVNSLLPHSEGRIRLVKPNPRRTLPRDLFIPALM